MGIEIVLISLLIHYHIHKSEKLFPFLDCEDLKKLFCGQDYFLLLLSPVR